MKKLPTFLLFVSLLAPLAAALPLVERQPDGVIVSGGDTLLKIEVCADDIVRVARAPDRAFFNHESLMLVKREGATPAWTFSSDEQSATMQTNKLQVRVNLATAAVSFFDLQGKPLLTELPGIQALQPAEVQGEKTFHVRQAWASDAAEALYGLGENQLGLLNLKGHDLDLWQHNGTVAVPMLVSTRGFGLLWDNNSYTRFGDLREPGPIPAGRLFDKNGQPGGLTASYYAGAHFEKLVAQRTEARIDLAIANSVRSLNQAIHPDLPAGGNCSVRWEGWLVGETSGLYTLETFSNSGIQLWIDDQLVMDHWRQGWLPWLEIARVPLVAGHRHRIKLEWSRDENMPTMRLRWKTPSPDQAISLWSEAGDGTDYYFVYGPQPDRVVAGYRRLTGAVPLMPIWSFGLWQSRQRYHTAQESLDVVTGFRQRGIPFDNIVQDWRYWPEGTWGSHQFDPKRFPDPAGWVRALHDQHARLMLSVWGKFYPGTKNFAALRERGFLYERNLAEGTRDWLDQPYTFYDAFNPAARQLFWTQMEQQLFHLGIDAWWMDATEPDLRPTPTLDGQRDYVHPTALGPGARVLNAYPLMNSAAIYEGQRAAAPDQRVFNLTRSGFAGQQRYAAAVWSGDSSSTWTALRKQIPAGLGFCLSGLPYWTMDIGGFSVPARYGRQEPVPLAPKPADAEEWRELNTRWFEFGTFVPFLRPHGEFPNREMWEFGGEAHPAYAAQLKFDRLRYRLLPYLYSLAGAVTHENSTIMRALVMDFTDDVRARDLSDQYMFGPAFLVSPVTTYQARSRRVYLPGSGGWFDFWTGAALAGGQTVEAAAPYDSIPLHVRAGAIIPFGPDLQYTQEKPADPITLYVYAGADGEFTLYEDDGLTYGYERGALARIPLRWDDAAHTLTIGVRTGSFPGMLAERTFAVVLVTKARPVGFSFSPQPAQTVHYRGEVVDVKLP